MKKKLPAKWSSTGRVLRSLRLESSFSQSQLARLINVHVQFVSNWERGLCYPPKHSNKKLAKALSFDDRERDMVSAALLDDYVRMINQEFKGLI